MKKYTLLALLVLLLGVLSLSGCASPYIAQANALKEAYSRGDISPNDYHARMNELQALDLQRRRAIAQVFYNLGESFQQQQNLQQQLMQQQQQSLQNTQLMMQMNQPKSGRGTIYTPSGNMYNYQYYGN